MNDLDLESWFQRATNRKWPMGYHIIMCPMTSRNVTRKVKLMTSIRLERNIDMQCLGHISHKVPLHFPTSPR